MVSTTRYLITTNQKEKLKTWSPSFSEKNHTVKKPTAGAASVFQWFE
jgi:hypothetical protein